VGPRDRLGEGRKYIAGHGPTGRQPCTGCALPARRA